MIVTITMSQPSVCPVDRVVGYCIHIVTSHNMHMKALDFYVYIFIIIIYVTMDRRISRRIRKDYFGM